MTTVLQQAKQNEKPGVLTHTSLMTLGKGIGKDELKGLELLMYLNTPTTDIIKCAADITSKPLTGEGSEYDRIAVTQSCLLHWKEITKATKPKERIRGLEIALRAIGKR
ncbi:hypothetical protein Btru_014838 [Bulinus truncatus]|nr:hypothetical protein Btru_014838 [Bulinus truncatus]